MGLQGVLAKHHAKFCGVLNGIDHETWDPRTDSMLPHKYSADSLEGKEVGPRVVLVFASSVHRVNLCL